MDIIPRKRCPICGEYFPATLEYFHKRSDRTGGLQSNCKTCRKKIDHERNQRPEVKARHKELQQRESVKEYHRKYEKTEKVKETRKKYRQTEECKERKRVNQTKRMLIPEVKEHSRQLSNRDEIRLPRLEKLRSGYPQRKTRQAEYYREHNQKPESKFKARSRGHRRRSALINAKGSFTTDEIKELYNLQDGRCGYCGIPLKFGYHADHMNPISKGGDNTIENILLTCPECNMAKHDKTLEEWMVSLHGNSISNR